MIAHSRLTFDRSYYEQYYSDWSRSISRFRKYSIPLAILTLVVGIAVVARLPEYRILGLVAIVFGVHQLIDATTYRTRWIKKRLNSGASKSGEISFYEDRIHLKSDSSEGHFMLSGFVDAIQSGHGIFLYPQKGISFYIPLCTIEPAHAIPRVCSVLNKEAEQGGDGDAEEAV